MSKYTTEVRYLCEVESGATESSGFNSINTILTNAAPKIFNFDFPIFDENYRLPLEVKILRHYYTREICEETVGLWKLRLQDKLNLIMPYYNKLYSSELILFNPLYDVDYYREHEGSSDGKNTNEEIGISESTQSSSGDRSQSIDGETVNNSTETGLKDISQSSENNSTRNDTERNTDSGSLSSSTTSNSTSTNTKNLKKTDRFSDTPQGSVGNLEANTYLTNARIIDDTGTDTTVVNASDSSQGSNSSTSNKTSNGNTNENSNLIGSESNSVEGTTKSNETKAIKESESNTQNVNASSNRSNVGTITNTEEYTEHVYGKQSGISNSKMLEEFRKTFLNIDKMIIDELATLFFGLW